MKKHFYLIRHGDKQHKRGNPPLTDLGHTQARQTAEYLADKNITYIASSPLLRTQQTAKYLSQKLHIPIVTHELLTERMNWGDTPKQTLEEFIAAWKYITQHRSHKPPVGDSAIEAGKRLECMIESLVSSSHSSIALITHGGIILDYLCNMFPNQELLAKTNATSVDLIEISECSITTVVFDETTKRFSLETIAMDQHLFTKE